MSNKVLTIGVIVALIIAGVALYRSSSSTSFGAVSPSDISASNFTEVTASNGMYIGAGGLTVNSGGLTLTTSNTATSTASLGCVQTVATSTATPIRLLFTASTTATAISGTQSGFVLWGYGTCPF